MQKLLFTSMVCFVNTFSYAQINPCEIKDAILIQSLSYSYEPNTVTINTGETVAWINIEGFHDVNGEINSTNGESFNNPENFYLAPTFGSILEPTCIGYYTFTIPGTYYYDCSIQDHALQGMIGSVVVTEENTQSLNEINFEERKKLIRTINYLGREVNQTTNKILFHIYDDGSVVKKFIVE